MIRILCGVYELLFVFVDMFVFMLGGLFGLNLFVLMLKRRIAVDNVFIIDELVVFTSKVLFFVFF